MTGETAMTNTNTTPSVPLAASDATIPPWMKCDAAQAVELIRALCVVVDEMTRQLTWLNTGVPGWKQPPCGRTSTKRKLISNG